MKTNSIQATKMTLVAGVLAAVVAIISVPGAVSAQTFTQTMRVGSRGGEVSTLQTVLAEDNTIYPRGLITGYFGSLTKSAVQRFQSRNGLGVDGIVGYNTRLSLNSRMSGGGVVVGGDTISPTIYGLYVNTNRNGATIGYTTSELAQATVFYNTYPLNPMEVGEMVIVNGANSAIANTNFGNNNVISISNLQPNTTYYYMVHSVDQAGNVTVTWPATFTTPMN